MQADQVYIPVHMQFISGAMRDGWNIPVERREHAEDAGLSASRARDAPHASLTE